MDFKDFICNFSHHFYKKLVRNKMGFDLFAYDDFINDIFNDFPIVISDDDDDEIKKYFDNLDDPDFISPNKISFEKFCKMLYNFIDPHNAILITTRMLLLVEKAFIEEFGSNWNKLRRDDKRKKERILEKFYENADTIINCIQTEPDKYLRYVREFIVKKYSKY